MFIGKYWRGWRGPWGGNGLSSGTPLDHFLCEIALHVDQGSRGAENKTLPWAAFVVNCPWGFATSRWKLSVWPLSWPATQQLLAFCSPTSPSIRRACHGAVPLFPMHKRELTLCFPCRSSQGFMHMKLTKTKEKYILGQNSPPFDSVPEVIHYYTTKKLPIKGAEHLSLLYPVAVRTL